MGDSTFWNPQGLFRAVQGLLDIFLLGLISNQCVLNIYPKTRVIVAVMLTLESSVMLRCVNRWIVTGVLKECISFSNFDILLTVHLSINLVMNQHDAQSFCFIISMLYASTCFEHCCAHHQVVKIVLYSIWYRHTCK